MISNSPWAHEVTISITDGYVPAASGGGGRRGGGLNGVSPSTSTMRFVVLWESALPVRQALARVKYGVEAATSPDVKVLLEPEEPNYVILVTGLPAAAARGDAQKIKDAISRRTTLNVKGKDAIRPTEVEVTADGKNAGAYFAFPKTMQFTLDDREVEFSTKIGDTTIQYKFQLKDMVFRGNLEL